MHYLLWSSKKRKTSKEKASEAYLQLSQQEVKTKQKKEKKVLVHVLRSLSACALNFSIFSCLLSRLFFFSSFNTRVAVELARASNALRTRIRHKRQERERKWERKNLHCAFFWVGGSYKRVYKIVPWYHFETCSQSEKFSAFFKSARKKK